MRLGPTSVHERGDAVAERATEQCNAALEQAFLEDPFAFTNLEEHGVFVSTGWLTSLKEREGRGNVALEVVLAPCYPRPATRGDDPLPFDEGFQAWIHTETRLGSRRQLSDAEILRGPGTLPADTSRPLEDPRAGETRRIDAVPVELGVAGAFNAAVERVLFDDAQRDVQ